MSKKPTLIRVVAKVVAPKRSIVGVVIVVAIVLKVVGVGVVVVGVVVNGDKRRNCRYPYKMESVAKVEQVP